ncbi:zeta toxin family protein [Photobacterium sp. CAU 1568]|uniref:Zeta toxin family protein n=1 Tax=Photobacterium arenosum TaxID=2774143 RepID=A0ABR9BTT1_9GAMM|nr:zeta toxin family protein [Photobacterium arenosum]MBD8515196.1 zeta toxin family protein [Photobacterium arenosum]
MRNIKDTERFLIEKLGYAENINTMVLAREISLIENVMSEYEVEKWVKSDLRRDEITKSILSDLIHRPVLEDDDHIRIGVGGAMPRSGVISEKKAVILIGLPASGKSTVASKIAEQLGSVIIDSDFAKRKFPEMSFPTGAAWVHKESDKIVLGDPPSLVTFSMNYSHNLVIPKIGSKPKSIRTLRDILTNVGYEVTLGLVWLDPIKALKRAIERYQISKRYIPIKKIFDEYGERPSEVYDLIKNDDEWSGFFKVSTDVDKGSDPIVIESNGLNFLLF